MGLNYINLDERTRNLMLAEIERDVAANKKLYLSENLSPQGKHDYPNLLRNAAKTGTDVTLAVDIKSRLNTHEKPRQLKSGKLSKPPVMRSNAHEIASRRRIQPLLHSGGLLTRYRGWHRSGHCLSRKACGTCAIRVGG